MVATHALPLTLERTIDNHAIRVASQTRLETVLDRICQIIDANGTSDLTQQYGCVWVEEQQQLVGRWSDRDAVRWCASGRSITPETTVAQVMEPPGQTLSLARDWDAITLLLSFQHSRTNRLPAMAPDDRLIGIATLDRLLEFLQPPNLLKLTHLREIALPTAATVASTTSIRDVARLLVERDLDSAIVATDLPRIVSNYDIFLALARGWDLDTTPVSTIARSVGQPLSPQDSLARAYRTMSDRHSRELLVADPETDGLSVATDLDLLRSLGPKQMYASLQRSYCSISQLKAKNQQLLQQRNAELERQVQQRTVELEATAALATRQVHRATLLNQIVRSIRSSLDLDRVLQTTVNCLHEALYVNRCLLFRPDPDAQMRSRHVSEATQARDSVLGIPCDLYRQYHATLSQGEPLVISSQSSSLPPETIASLESCGIRSILVVPLICGDEFLGGISLHQCDAERHWIADEISFVQQIADHCAIAIQQSQLYRQLRQSEANYRNLFDNAIEGIYQTTPDGRYLNVNPALAQMYGYDSPEALIAANLTIDRDIYVDPQRRLEFTRHLETEGRVTAFESQVYRRDGSTFWIRENARAARDESGTLLYFEGTVEDISDRKQAEINLKQQQAFLRHLIDANPNLIFVKDWHGRFALANQALANLYGTTVEDLLGKTDADFNPNPVEVEQFLQADREVMVSLTRKWIAEETVSTPNGKFRYFQTSKTPLIDADGVARRILGVATDITARKYVELALIESESRFRAIFNGTYQFTGLLSLDGTLLELNQTALTGTGSSRDDAIDRPLWELPWWHDTPELRQYLQQAVSRAARGELVRGEVEFWTNDKTLAISDFSLKPLTDRSGRVVQLIAEGRDITDRKQAERELHLLQAITTAVSECPDFDSALQIALNRIGQATGWTYGEAWIPNPSHGCLEVSPQWFGDRGDSLLAFRQVTQTVRFFPASGLPGRVWASQQPEWIRDVSVESPSLFWRADIARQVGLKAAFGVPILDRQQVVAVLVWFAGESQPTDRATMKLITTVATQLGELMRRKQADAALRASQQKLALHVQQTPLAAIEWTTEFEVASWNPAAEAIFGYSAEEAMGKTGSELLLPAAIRDQIDGVWQTLIRQRGGKRNINENITKDGRVIVCEWYNTPLIDANGRTIGVASLAQDITDRVEARLQLQQLNQQLETQVRDRTAELQQTIAALRDSEARYRLMAENSTDIITRHALDGTYLYVSPASRTLLGYEPEEFVGRNAFELFHPQDLGAIFNCYEQVITDPAPRTVSYRIRRQDGNYVWFETTTRALWETDTDLPQEIVAVSRDISARKQAETELKHAKEQLEAMLDAIPGFVSWMDRDLRYLGVNRHLATAFGRQPEEFVGRELGFIKANSEFARFIADFFQDTGAIAANATIELPIGGQTRQYAIIVQKYHKGKKAVSVGIDVSDRMAAEAQIKQSLQEKEVLLKEIHHRVKNNLQIVSSLLKLQAGTIDDPEVLKPFTDSYNRVRSMALIHEKLYQSNDLARVQTVEYLRNLTANLFKSYTATTNPIQLDLQLDDIDLNIDTAIPCGLIITELLSNALKYAFPDNRAGTVSLEFRDLGDRLRLSVCDNGVGLPDDFDLDESESLGLQLVTSLTEQLHGELHIQSEPRTCFAIEFKRPKSLD